MIPYLPEGPPPLDEDEDTGSPVDAPVGLQGILHNLTSTTGESFGDFVAKFPAPTPDTPPHINRVPDEAAADSNSEATTREKDKENDDAFEADFEAFQSVTSNSNNLWVAADSGSIVVHEDTYGCNKQSDIETTEETSGLNAFQSAQCSDVHISEPESDTVDRTENATPIEVDFGAFQSEIDNTKEDLDFRTRQSSSPESGERPVIQAGNIIEGCGDVPSVEISETPSEKSGVENTDEDEFDAFQSVSQPSEGNTNNCSPDHCDNPVNSGEGQSANCIQSESKSHEDGRLEFSDRHESDGGSDAGGDEFAAFQSGTQPSDSNWADSNESRSGFDENPKFEAFHESECQYPDNQWIGSSPQQVPKEDDTDESDHSFKLDAESAVKTPEALEDEDDFGDFNSTVVGSEPCQDIPDFSTFKNHVGEEDAEFGDFSQPQQWQTTDKDESDFGSFETTNAKNCPVDETSNLSTGGFLEKILANMETVLKTCFENSEHIADEALVLNSLDEEDKENNDAESVWTFLVDFDKAFALQYQVGKSVGNDWFLKSLNIDSRNVLKNPKKATLPIFASQLGLLEPTRGSAENMKDCLVDSMAAPSDSDPTIPAPQFDWNSSGLTNPLDSTNSNFYLDLDFFEATQLKSSAASGHIKSELEEQFLCKELTNNNSPVMTEVKIDPVQSILTQATRGASVSSNPTKNCAELSSAAQVLVDSLPDLSYMKARVLMFPIGHS